jgi:hypothetical protein
MSLQKTRKPQNYQNEPENGQRQAISCHNYGNLSGLSLSWHGIGKEQLGLHIQSKNYWFGIPRRPSWVH